MGSFEVSSRPRCEDCVSLVGRCGDLLLRVLALVVLSIASTVVLRLGVVPWLPALTVPTTLSAPSRGSARSAATIPARRGTVAVVGACRGSVSTTTTATSSTSLGVRRSSALPHLRAPPRGDVRSSTRDVSRARPRQPSAIPTRTLARLAKFSQEASVFGVETTLRHVGVASGDVHCVRVPVDGTITGHVAGTTADTADDVRGKVALFWTVVLPVTDTSTVLANLVLVVTERTVQSSKFTKLVALVIILTFGG